MDDICEQVRHDLVAVSDEKTRKSGMRFFKEEVTLYGVKAADVRRIAKDHFVTLRAGSKKEILSLCDKLWQSDHIEVTLIACEWSHRLSKQYMPEDFSLFEKWVTGHVNNWASCDTLCNHTVGDFIQMYPGYLSELKKWAVSDNRWVRRASAVTLIVPARKGKFLNDIFDIATILLEDKDDMVQKGYGWMLKAASEAHQQEVFDFVMKNKTVMPRTALRYAIEKMPADLRAKAMEK
jgi:3-methyladenine DNA glycosylase AlkD